MINRALLRALRNDLPMAVTLRQLGEAAPPSKQDGARLRFRCPHCGEMLVAVNPRNNLAHCFNCGQNLNNIDLLVALGYEFKEAVAVLTRWLRLYQAEAGRLKHTPSPPRPRSDGATRIARILREAFERED